MFNDEGVKQLFIFQPDGSLLITTNGEVYNSTWKYISVNNSVVISYGDKAEMFHPTFFDNVVFALEKDGGSSCLFMIDERNQNSFSPKSLSDLQYYFAQKEQSFLEQQRKEIEHEKQRQIDNEAKRLRDQKQREVEEFLRNSEEQELFKQKEAEIRLRDEAAEIEESLLPNIKGKSLFVPSIIAPIVLVLLLPVEELSFFEKFFLAALSWIAFVVLSFFVLVAIYNSRSERWKKDHPNDPRNKFIS